MLAVTFIETIYLYKVSFTERDNKNNDLSRKSFLDQFLMLGELDKLWNGFMGDDDDEESAQDAIDDYYSRPHIREPVPLIVGGSDGSGTRAFVDILVKLGVPMVIDDAGTADAHGKVMCSGKGWPCVVSKVLNVTRSANYSAEMLPASLII